MKPEVGHKKKIVVVTRMVIYYILEFYSDQDPNYNGRRRRTIRLRTDWVKELGTSDPHPQIIRVVYYSTVMVSGCLLGSLFPLLCTRYEVYR